MKKVLILGAIEAFCDLVMDAKEKGLDSVVCDFYENAPAKKIANEYYDVSTMDVEKLIQVAEDIHPLGIVTAFSDRNLLPGYELAKKLGLPTLYSPEIIQILTDKIRMKEHFKKSGFPVIEYRILDQSFQDQDLEDFIFPVIIKPVDAYGSKGIYICQTIQEVREKFEETVKNSLNYKNKAIIEEFYPVNEISITAWVKEGKAFVTCIYDVYRNYEDHFILSSVSFPSKYTGAYLEELKNLVQNLVNSLGIQEGPVTVQCFVGERGLKVSEFLYRLAGGSPYLYPTLMGGPNIAKMLLDYQVGDKIDYQNLESFSPVCEGKYYDILICAKESGKIYHNVPDGAFLTELENVEKGIIYHKSGVELSNVPAAGRVVIRVFYHQKMEDKRTYSQILDELKDKIHITNEDGKDITEFRYPQKTPNGTPYEVVF